MPLPMRRYDTNSVLLGLLSGALLLLLMVGCASEQTGRGWGQDATYHPEGRTLRRAALDALLSPETLAPLAGALVFAMGNFDRRASDWATTHHPIFGSEGSAETAGDNLLYALMGEAVLTAALTPSGDDPDWLLSKAKGFVVEGVAEAATSGIQTGTTDAFPRTRPDGSGSGSFFSGHASAAFASETLANRNLASIGLQDEWRIPLGAGNLLLAGGVAWARVEAGDHFPTDVLVGAAVGHFVSAFVHDAFLGLPRDSRFHLEIYPNSRGAMVVLSIDF